MAKLTRSKKPLHTFMGMQLDDVGDLMDAIQSELGLFYSSIKHFNSRSKKDYKQLQSYTMHKLMLMYEELQKFTM